MYAHEAPRRLTVRELDAVEQCLAALAGPGSKLQRSALDRWIAVKDSLAAALQNGDIDQALADNAAWLDPVQFDVVAGFVRTGHRLLDGEPVVFDDDDAEVIVPLSHLNANLWATTQLLVDDPNGRERLKIKTGKRGTTPAEAAILLTGGDPDATYADVMLGAGTIEPYDLTDGEIATKLERLTALAATQPDRTRRNPGLHCYFCARVARCGQYPPPAGIQVTNRHRTIVLSKTDLMRLDQCHRRIAWQRLHSLPADDGDEDADATNQPLSTGITFHGLIGAALLTDDPQAAFEAGLAGVPESEHQTMRWLFERHVQLDATHTPVDCTRTEYPIGVAVPLLGIDVDSRDRIDTDAQVAVVVIAFADAVGRERDGTPAVIEHRTGRTANLVDERETALYALATARLLGADTVAVHLHALGLEDEPHCERIVYDNERLTEADSLLRRVVAPVAQWHPLDALDPTYQVDGWCAGCRFEQRCTRHRSEDPPIAQAENDAAPPL